MTIQEIKNHLDEIQISDLRPRYNFMNGYGSTPIADWQYESVVKSNISLNNQTFGFHEPITNFEISSGVINQLRDLLKEFFKDYLVSDSIITAVGTVKIDIFSRCLIDCKIAKGLDFAINSLQKLINNKDLGYVHCDFLDGLNVSSDVDFGDFMLSPTNTSFDILPNNVFRTVGNELIIDRSIIKFRKQYKTNLYLPEWIDEEQYSEKIRKMSDDDLYKFHTPVYQQGYLIYNVDDVFFYSRNSSYYIDILCYVLSVHFQKSVLNTWPFICPENTLLRTCCDFLGTNANVGKYNMNNLTVGRTKPIDMSDKDIQDINHFYQKMDELCEKHIHKDQFIKSIWHYNNTARNSDDVLRSQELVNAFACLVAKVTGKHEFQQIFGTHIPKFIAKNIKDKGAIIDNLRKLRQYRNAQPHPHAKNLQFTIDGISESVFQNCLQYYKRLILKCIQENKLCPS
ncbi:MAG: hypothetical protein OXG88_03415 [Gammaproteobacteria bacterium]|nr:hypothetical protein [Gammaproteobacteria bacterium]